MEMLPIKLPQDVLEVLEVIYEEAKKINPDITERIFFERIVREWLRGYRKRRWSKGDMSKDKVLLKNNLEATLKLAGKTQTQVAKEIGINRTYLGQIIKGRYDPSVKVAFLLAEALYSSKIEDMFYLEPVPIEE